MFNSQIFSPWFLSTSQFSKKLQECELDILQSFRSESLQDFIYHFSLLIPSSKQPSQVYKLCGSNVRAQNRWAISFVRRTSLPCSRCRWMHLIDPDQVYQNWSTLCTYDRRHVLSKKILLWLFSLVRRSSTLKCWKKEAKLSYGLGFFSPASRQHRTLNFTIPCTTLHTPCGKAHLALTLLSSSCGRLLGIPKWGKCLLFLPAQQLNHTLTKKQPDKHGPSLAGRCPGHLLAGGNTLHIMWGPYLAPGFHTAQDYTSIPGGPTYQTTDSSGKPLSSWSHFVLHKMFNKSSLESTKVS